MSTSPIRPHGILLLGIGAFLILGCGRSSEPRVAARAPDPASLRTLATGRVVGFENPNGGHAWLGIPFAKPPVGSLRWRAPDPPEPWTDTREALAIGSACPQLANPLGGPEAAQAEGVIGDEDCLYLNVFAPRFAPGEVPTGDARLPVLFWIHGGGNSVGQGGGYDGGRLAVEQNVVVVTTNYRLGALGWFRHPALAATARDARDASGNFGILDLIRGLEWVRDDIAAFGGDPENVTIYGESAGGHDVFSLLVASDAGGLFHRAISQSGGTWTETVTRAEAYAADGGAPHSSREIVVRLLAQGGAEDARARADALSAEQTRALLLDASAEQLIEAHVEGDEGAFGMYDSPRVFREGVVLPADGIPEAIAAGRFHRVPVILGTNRDESKLFMSFDPDRVWRLFWMFPMLRDADRYDRDAEYSSNLWKVSGVDEPAAAMVAAGHTDVFAYRFDWDEQGQVLVTDLSRLLGAAHGLEIPFVFDSFDSPLMARLSGGRTDPARDALARSMRDYWTEFARTGSPGTGGGGHPRWVAWSPAARGPKVMVLDSANDGGQRMTDAVLTHEGVLDELMTDERFADDAERCAYMQTLLGFSDLTPEEYSERGCGEPPSEVVLGDAS